MTTPDWSGEVPARPGPRPSPEWEAVFELAKDLFVAEGGNKPPHRCINDAMTFVDEWRTFLGMDPASPSGQGNLRGEP